MNKLPKKFVDRIASNIKKGNYPLDVRKVMALYCGHEQEQIAPLFGS